MPRYAVIVNGVVDNVVMSDDKHADESMVRSDTANRGDLYNTSTRQFTKAPAAPGPRMLSMTEFRQRLTNGKFASVTTLANTDAQAFTLLLDLISRTEVDLDDAKLSAGLDYFISKGALTAGDKAMLLA